MKIEDLIAVLKEAQSQGTKEVRCSWESIIPDIHCIYIGNERSHQAGVLLLDSDGGLYEQDYSAKTLWEKQSPSA